MVPLVWGFVSLKVFCHIRSGVLFDYVERGELIVMYEIDKYGYSAMP